MPRGGPRHLRSDDRCYARTRPETKSGGLGDRPPGPGLGRRSSAGRLALGAVRRGLCELQPDVRGLPSFGGDGRSLGAEDGEPVPVHATEPPVLHRTGDRGDPGATEVDLRPVPGSSMDRDPGRPRSGARLHRQGGSPGTRRLLRTGVVPRASGVPAVVPLVRSFAGTTDPESRPPG